LVVEDDRSLAGMLAELLREPGYDVEVAHDGQRALHLALTHEHDLYVFDRMLPAVDGLDLLSRLRARGILTPALVLSALGNPADIVNGLDAGAEDYLSKPFDVDELLARVRALLRRQSDGTSVVRLPYGDLDVETRTVRTRDGRSVELSARESLLLGTLARRPSQVFSRGALLREVFPDADSDGTVDTYVHYLRRKLGRSAIRTVRGVGYVLGSG
jgi:DNA-binding response OmpR family regulator